MTALTAPPPPGLLRQPDPVRVAIPGSYHGPLDDHPHAMLAVLDNDVPTVTLVIGTVAGRIVSVAVTDAHWLSDLAREVQLAQSRLAAWMTGPGRAA